MTGPEKTNTLTIHTPEGIEFSLLLAGPVTRFLAWLIDFFCILVISDILNRIFSIMNTISIDLARAITIICFFVVSIGYNIILEWYWNGQTIGKRLLNIRVLDVQGLHLDFSQIVIRNLLRFVDGIPGLYMVGGLSVLFSRQAQRLGDMAANTIVIWNPKISEPDFAQLFSDKYNSFRNYPHLGARLRQNVPPVLAEIALKALFRRKHLEPLARLELFSKIAAHFKNIVIFPQEATDGLSDEQYTRNAVEILYRKPRS